MENSINITPTPSGKPATADLYKYSVGNAIQGVDPLPTPRTSEEAKKKALADIDKAFLNASRPDAFKFDKPTTFNAGTKGHNFDRYYSHPKFKQLGFSPLRDNESFYNQHSSTWDDLGRAAKQMPKMLGLGVTSTFGNWGSMLSMKPDTESADEMEKAMSIASSSRDTLGAKTVNFLSNVPYTLGVIGEIYAEEAALMLASRIPGMQGLAAARTGQNILRGGLAFDRLFDTFRAANNVQNAKQAYDASKTLGSFAKSWLPFQNTTELFRDSGRAAANIDKLSDLAAGYKTFGAFYRDLREINLVTAEAKLEGGFVQNEVANNLISDFKKKNGRDPNDQEAQSIYQQARTAGYTAGYLNTGGIYLSNKVVLERALKGLPFADEIEHLAGKGIKNGKLIKNADWKTTGKNPWEVVSGLGSGVKALGNKYYRQQILKNAPKNGLRFVSANMMEGVQEMYQEGTAKGVTDYYTETFLNPSKVGKAQMLSSIKTGVKSQMSGEGLEVFLSGFLMAGPIQAVQSSVHGAYNLGQLAVLKGKDKAFKADPANAGKVSPYDKYLKDQKAYNDKVVNALNFLTKDTKSYFSNVDANVKAQKDFADLFEAAVVEGDVKGAVDAKDDSFAQHIMTLMESGHLDLFVDHLNGLKQLDEKELAESLYENAGNNTYDKKTTLERVDAVVGRINQIKDTYNKYQGLTNPFDFRQDPIGYFAFESARKIAVFNDFSYQRTGERMTSILEKLKTNTLLAGVDYMDIATMFSINPKLMGSVGGGIGGTNNMLAILKQEIDNMNAGTDEQKAEAVKLQDKYDKLKSLSTLIQDYASNLDTLQTATEENADELATSTEESEKLLRTAFGDYIKLLAKNNGTTILDKDIDTAFDDFRDYWRLSRDKTQFAEAVNALNNPEYFSNLAQRINGAVEVASQVSAKRAKDEVDEYRRRHATDEFLNGLLSQFNAYISEDEAEAYLANNIIPQKFIDADSGQVIPSNDPRYQKILEFIDDTDDSFFDLTGKRLFKPVVEDAGEKLYKEGTDLFYAEELKAYATQTIAAKEDSDKRNFVDMAKQFGFDRSAPMSEVTIASVLTAIINGPGTVQQKELARLLKGLIDGNEKITFVRNHYTNSTYDQRNGVMVDARYSSEDYKVLGMDKVSIEYSILSALMQKLVIENSSDKEFTDKIKDIRESLLKELSDQQKAQFAYAFTNNTSFLSEMLTNPFFANLAAQYEYTGDQVEMTEEAQTMFGAFFKTLTDFIKKLLNITNEERSVYKQALNVLANKLSEGPKSTEEETPTASTAEEFSKLDPKLQEELKAAFEKKKAKVAETDPEIAKGMTLDQWYLNDLEARRIISNFKTKQKAKEKDGEGSAGTVITMDNIPQLATALGYTIEEINAMILDGTPTQELLDIINNKVVSPNASVLNEEGMEAISDAIREARQKLAAKKLSLTEDDKNYVDEDGTLFERVTTLVKDPFEADSKTASFRGTIIDDLTRDFLAGRIQTINEFKDAYTASRNKISSKPGFTDKDASELPIFTANFLNELFDNLRTVKRALDRNGIKIISDIPTLYGKLDGKDAAGSIDLLGYNNKGEIFIIDLKTSSQERNEQYALEAAFEEAMGEDYGEFKSILKNSENDLQLTRSRLTPEMQTKMTIAFAKFGKTYPELKESAQKGSLYLYKEGDQAQLAAYRELLRQSTGIVADKLYIFPMIASLEKGSSIKYSRNIMVKAPGRSGYVMDITTPDSTYKISDLRQTVFDYPTNPIVKPGASAPEDTKTPETPDSDEKALIDAKIREAISAVVSNTESRNSEYWYSTLDHPDFPEIKGQRFSQAYGNEVNGKFYNSISAYIEAKYRGEIKEESTETKEQPALEVVGNNVVYTVDGSIAQEYNSPEEAQKGLQEWLASYSKSEQTGTGDTKTEPTPRESAIQAAEELIKTAPSKAKNIRKDIEMMRVSDGFIGSKAPETKDTYISATEAYQRGWGTAANPSDFTGMTAVMISGSGTWNPKQTGGKINNEDINRHFQLFYKPLIDKAINQGVTTFNVGTAAGMDKMVSDYLEVRGFQKTSRGEWNEFTNKEEVDKDSYDYLKKQAGPMVLGETKGASIALWDKEKLMWRFFNKKTKQEYSFKKSKQFAKNMFRSNRGWFKVWWNQTLNDAQRKEMFELYFKAYTVFDRYRDLVGDSPADLELIMMKNLYGVKFRKSNELTWAKDVSEKSWFTEGRNAQNWDQFIRNLKTGEDITDSGIINEETTDEELRDMLIDIMMRNPKGVTQKAIDALEREISPKGLIDTATDEFFDVTGIDFEDFMAMYDSLGQSQDIYYIDPDTYEVTDPVDKIQFVKRERRPEPPKRTNNVAPQFKGKVIYITTDASIQEDFSELGDGVKKGNDFIEDVITEPQILNRLKEVAREAKKSANSAQEDELAEKLIRALSANIINLKDVMYALNPLAATNTNAKNAVAYLYTQALKNAKEEAATGTTVVFDNTGALPYYDMFDVIIVNSLSDTKRDAKTDNISKAERAVPAEKKSRISAIYGLDILKGTAQQTTLGDIRARIGAVTTKSQLTLIRAELNNALTLGTLDKELAIAGITYEEAQALIAAKLQEVSKQLSIKDIVISKKEPVFYEFNDNGTKLILLPYDKGVDFVSFHDITDKFENLETATDLDLRTNVKFRNLAEEDINQNLRPMTTEETAPKPAPTTVKKSNDAQSDLTNDAATRIQEMKAKRTTMDNTSTNDSMDDLFNCSTTKINPKK